MGVTLVAMEPMGVMLTVALPMEVTLIAMEPMGVGGSGDVAEGGGAVVSYLVLLLTSQSTPSSRKGKNSE